MGNQTRAYCIANKRDIYGALASPVQATPSYKALEITFVWSRPKPGLTKPNLVILFETCCPFPKSSLGDVDFRSSLRKIPFLRLSNALWCKLATTPFVCTSSVKSAIVSLLYLHDDVTTVEKQHADLTEKLNSRCSNNRLSCSSQVKTTKRPKKKSWIRTNCCKSSKRLTPTHSHWMTCRGNWTFL